MSDESAFMRTIIESPEDAAARLVFSDWLEEHGQSERAEFIRLQIRLATMKPWDESYHESKLREKSLIQMFQREWMDPVQNYLHPMFNEKHDFQKHSILKRGLIDTFFADESAFLAEPDGLMDAAPITGLIFLVQGPVPDALLNAPSLRRVSRLRFLSSRSLSGSHAAVFLSPGDVRRIAEARGLHHLKELDLSSQPTTSEEVRALVQSPSMQNLERLTIAHSALDRPSFHAIGSHLTLPNLRHLHLNNNYNSGSVLTWSKHGWPQQLRTLDLSSCDIHVETMAEFLSGVEWPNLETLILQRLAGSIEEEQMANVFAAMPRLKHLNVCWQRTGGPVGDWTRHHRYESIESLSVASGYARINGKVFLTTKAFPHLRELDLSGNTLQGGAKPLQDSALSQSLRVLNMMSCDLTMPQMAAFAKSVQMPALTSLSLGEAKDFPPKTLAELLNAEGFPQLRHLKIKLPAHKNLYEVMGASRLMNQIKCLTIQGGILRSDCLDVMEKEPAFRQLSFIEFWGTTINAEARQRLTEMFGERFVA